MTRLLPLLVALAVWPAWAGPPLESLRQTRAQAVERLAQVRGKQTELKKELEALAARIEALKKEKKDAVLPGAELEGALRRSQELSDRLSELAREEGQAQAEAQRETAALLDAVSAEASAQRGKLAKAKPEERAVLFGHLSKLRDERAALRAELATPKPQQVATRPSDDPDELLEQADLVRDTEDKVRQRIREVKERLAEVKEERDFDRRMGEFLGEEARFDEQDRRVRVSRGQTSFAPPRRVTGSPSAAGEAAGSPAAFEAGPPVSGVPVGGGGGAAAANTSPPPTTSRDTTPTTPVGSTLLLQRNQPPFTSSVSDSRPEVGRSTVRGTGAGGGELGILEGELKELEALAEKLKGRADDLEKRANQPPSP